MRSSFLITILISGVAIAATPDIPLVDIPTGRFMMGGDKPDELPRHEVTIARPFRMGATEVTNAQFEALMPDHRALRGRDGVSLADDEPAVNVTFADAVEFCRRLSSATGRRFRLPTEAEWEYACRACTSTPYWAGDTLPAVFCRNQTISRDYSPVDLRVGITPPNPFGLHEMHGGVEEWCSDWYSTYSAAPQTDPQGPRYGDYRVTRGGSHHTPVEYLRSGSRAAMIPADCNSLVGFRVVEELPYVWAAPSSEPSFAEPQPFVIPPHPDSTTPFYNHNHQPAITYCDNGDLLAIWFSADRENDRRMVVLSSRLTPGAASWTPAEEFLCIPGRNLTGSSLLNDGRGTLYHFNGVEAAGDWQNLALAMRRSTDSGRTWSPLELIEPRHCRRHQVIAGPIILSDSTIVQLCDAGAGSHDGTSIHLLTPADSIWRDPWDGAPLPEFTDGGTGTTIAGIHAGIVELADGTLMTLGRGNSIPDADGRPRMPESRSTDRGATWTYRASSLPPIDGGQRLVLRRLNEGPLLLISFTDHPERTPEADRGMDFADGRGYGLYAALSFDEGRTWPVRRLLTDGRVRTLPGGAWTGQFIMDAHHAEPKGYLAATQTPDGTIHLLSSGLHYRFNLAWLLGGGSGL